MKAAVMVGADWPGDEVVLVTENEALARALANALALGDLRGVSIGRVNHRIVALLGREAFRELRALIVAADEAARQDGAREPLVTTLRRLLDTLARELASARDDDRSGDPLPGTPLHAAMAQELAEAGR